MIILCDVVFKVVYNKYDILSGQTTLSKWFPPFPICCSHVSKCVYFYEIMLLESISHKFKSLVNRFHPLSHFSFHCNKLLEEKLE